MDPRIENRLLINRRHFFGRASVGIGSIALASLLGQEALAKRASHTRIGGLDAFNRLDTILHNIVGASGFLIGLPRAR